MATKYFFPHWLRSLKGTGVWLHSSSQWHVISDIPTCSVIFDAVNSLLQMYFKKQFAFCNVFPWVLDTGCTGYTLNISIWCLVQLTCWHVSFTYFAAWWQIASFFLFRPTSILGIRFLINGEQVRLFMWRIQKIKQFYVSWVCNNTYLMLLFVSVRDSGESTCLVRALSFRSMSKNEKPYRVAPGIYWKKWKDWSARCQYTVTG